MRTIAKLSTFDATAQQVMRLIELLSRDAPKGAVVHVRGWNSGDIESGTLIERSLTDGSLVYDILLNHREQVKDDDGGLTLTHAAEHMQSSTSSFTNLTPENKARQEAALLLRRKAREVRAS